MTHDYGAAFRAPDWTSQEDPEAITRSIHAALLVPGDATEADIRAARDWERTVRQDQRDRVLRELERYYDSDHWVIGLAGRVPVEPTW